MEYSLHNPGEDDWRQLRDIRIRSIVDTPIAFMEDESKARALPESEWRFRGRRNDDVNSHQVVAVTPPGEWIATFAAFVSQGQPDYAGGPVAGREGPQANLVGVWIDPAHRGAELGERLLAEVFDWVRGRELDEIYLMVHLENPRAAAFYRRTGFIETGVQAADPRGGAEIEMRMDLRTP